MHIEGRLLLLCRCSTKHHEAGGSGTWLHSAASYR